MPRILVVDDEAHILRVISMWLRRHGHELFEATDGAEALALFDAEDIDMIISDMNMPVMTGLELVKTIREERKSDVPFLLLTARCDQQELETDLQPFNVGLYPKPFVPSRLVADVRDILDSQKTEGVAP